MCATESHSLRTLLRAAMVFVWESTSSQTSCHLCTFQKLSFTIILPPRTAGRSRKEWQPKLTEHKEAESDRLVICTELKTKE